MTFKHLCMISGAALALAACEPASEQSPPVPDAAPKAEQISPDTMPAQLESDNTAKEGTATIDWNAARTDLATETPDERPLVNIQSADGIAPPVPVLLPTGGSVRVATDGSGPRFKKTDDGYYAVFPYENYDVIVNGTNEIIGSRPEGPRDETAKFTATAAGAQVALSRYGADYLVEFECYKINPATGTCIDEAEAMEVAESLVIRGTR